MKADNIVEENANELLARKIVSAWQEEKFLSAERFANFPYRFVGTSPRLGVRWEIFGGRLGLETYTGHDEPVIMPADKPRIVFWRPVGTPQKIKGWWRLPLQSNPIYLTGFTQVDDPAQYFASWDRRVREYRNQFYKKQAAGDYRIVPVSAEVFAKDFPRKGKYRAFYDYSMNKIMRCSELFGPDSHYYEVLDKAGHVRAGLLATDSPQENYSRYMVGFRNNENVDQCIGVGIIDHWFREGISRGIRYFDFGVFWVPGNPPSWKGFSHFKAQFGVKYIRYGKTLIKFVRASP